MAFLIKATYTEGRHAGESYLMRKGGYVTDEDSYQWADTTYKSKGIAQAVCRRLAENNEIDCRIEREDRERWIRKGRKPIYETPIYTAQTFEPYPVPADKFVNI